MAEVDPTRVISGFRPTSDLTVGNYLGAIQPSLELQEDASVDLFVFVADLHGLTDHDPREIGPHRTGVVRDCLALGVDPDHATLYMQSDLEAPVTMIANRLAPYVGVGRLSRTPNLKEKMQQAMDKGKAASTDAGSANFAMLGYPVMMAADIFSQKAEKVAVGEDQEPHLEVARDLAGSFNGRFGEEVFIKPTILTVDALRVAALNGAGKMSKNDPDQAILLTDHPDIARKKIKKAMTANPGEWNDVIESHFNVAERTAIADEQRAELAALREAHAKGERVMAGFKKLWGDITEGLLVPFQDRRALITDDYVHDVLALGAQKAGANAAHVLEKMRGVMTL